MANTLPVIDDITLAALDVFENTLVAAKSCSRKLEKGFGVKGAQRGDSVRVRKPAQGTVRTGTAWSGQNIEEQYDTMTLSYQKGIDFSMTSKERKLDLNSLTDQVIKPFVVRLANEVDKDILEVASQATFNAVGTPGTTPTTMQTYIDAGVLLTNYTCPRGRGERYLMVNAEMEGDIAYALALYHNPTAKIGSVFDSAEMPYAAGMHWGMDQNVYTHTVGTYAGTARVNGASQSGAALDTDGWDGSSNLTVGDRFTIADVYAVNPVTKATLSNLQQFVVTAAISDTAGGVMDDVAISPSIVGPGSAFQNVSALPADNALITMFGSTGNVYAQGLVFNKEAVALAIVPLEKPEGVNQASMKYDEQSGVGLRYIEWYDGDTDLWKSRFDIVYGILVQRPEWSCAIAAA